MTLKVKRGKPGLTGLGIKVVSHNPGMQMTKFLGKIIFKLEFNTETNC